MSEKYLEILFLLIIPCLLRLWVKSERKWYYKYLKSCKERNEKRYSIQKMLWCNINQKTEAIHD